MRSLCSLLFVILLAVQSGSAQPSRPAIGIALEGGGAHGLAHIGVLKWLEEHRIPVDYVAGTSMGGLIGGAYSTGLHPTDIEQILKNVDWVRTLDDKPAYTDLAFRRKEDARAYPNRLEFGLKNGLRLPPGLSAGQEVGLILDRIALPYSPIRSFDDLAIPFRCVAVDLVSGQEEVFDRGSLALAMRATMSIPGFFSPVRLGNKIFVDGGLLDNLPVGVAREMGAHTVIAVHLDQAKIDPKAPLSSLSVFSWSIDAVTSSNERRSLKQADIVVKVSLLDVSWDTFTALDEIVRRGYAAAAQNAAQLLPLALSDEEWSRYRRLREERRKSAATQIAFVDVIGVDGLPREMIKSELEEFAGKPLEMGSIENKLRELRGTKRFQTLDYRLTQRDNTTGLLITATEMEHAPPILDLLFDINGSDYTNAQFSVGGRITFMDVWRPGSEARVDLAFGSRYEATGEYLMPVSPGKPAFIAPRVSFESDPFPVYSGTEHVADYRLNRVGGGLDLGYAIDRYSEFRIGYEATYLSFSRKIGSPELPDLDGLRSGARVRYALDRLNDPVVPQQGHAAIFTGRWVDSNPGSTSSFPSTELELQKFKRFRGVNAVFLTATGGSTFGKNDGGLPVFSLGGPLRLSAYATNELLTNQYFLFRLGYTRHIKGSDSVLGAHTYIVALYEIGKAYGLPNASRLPNDLAVGVIAKTFFGPFLIGGAYGDTGHRKIFFRVGRVF